MRPLNEEYPLYEVPQVNTYAELLESTQERFAAKLALEDLAATPIPRLTYAELYEHAVRFGRALRHLGLAERDHVAIIGENRVQWTLAYLAAVPADLVVVPIDKSLQENEILTVLHASDAKAVMFSEALPRLVLTLANAVRGLKVLHRHGPPDARRQGPLDDRDDRRRAAPIGTRPVPDDRPGRDGGHRLHLGRHGPGQGRDALAAQPRRQPARHAVDDRAAPGGPVPLGAAASTTPTSAPAGSSARCSRAARSTTRARSRPCSRTCSGCKATILLGVPLLYEKMYRRITAGDRREEARWRCCCRSCARRRGPARRSASTGLRRKVFKQGPRALRRRDADLHRRRRRARPAGGARAALPGVHLHPGVRAHRDLADRRAEPPAQVPGRRGRAAAAQPRGADREPDGEGRGEIEVTRAVGDARLLQERRGDARRCCATAGSTPATSGRSTPTASCTSAGARRTSSSRPTARTSSPRSSRTSVNRIPLRAGVGGARHPRSRTATRRSASSSSPTPRSSCRLAERLGVDVTRELGRADARPGDPRPQPPACRGTSRSARSRVRETEFAKTTTQKIRRHLIHEEQDRSPAISG